MRPERQRGFGLMLAVFILTVLAALGAYIVTISRVQHATSALTLQQMRALNAARSGIEWAAHEALCPTTGVPCAAQSAQPCPPDTSVTPDTATLSAFTVTVKCTESTHKVRGRNINIYIIDATATAGAYGSPDYVARHVQGIVGEAL